MPCYASIPANELHAMAQLQKYTPRYVVADDAEAGDLSIGLDGAAKCSLSVCCQRVSFVQNNELEGHSAAEWYIEQMNR